MEYRLVIGKETQSAQRASSRPILEEEVNKFMQMGWEPLGSVTLIRFGGLEFASLYGQAMVKR